MDLTAKFLKKSEVREVSPDFLIQEFYVDMGRFDQYTGEKRENIVKFQLLGLKVDELANVEKGDLIKVFFNIKGRIYDKADGTRAHIQNIDAWKIEKLGAPAGTTAAKPKAPTPPPPPTPAPAPVAQNVAPGVADILDADDFDMPF